MKSLERTNLFGFIIIIHVSEHSCENAIQLQWQKGGSLSEFLVKMAVASELFHSAIMLINDGNPFLSRFTILSYCNYATPSWAKEKWNTHWH